WNHATSAVGYASSSEPVVRFGLGAARGVEEAEVLWPSGALQKLGPMDGGRIVELKEPPRP
ncbi:MAG TPA: ASPIC/UnbV domain-containing protein, partial [Bryobacteraceae bacterium]|nr:ASPIC/UnbV domain-containing protein [Bryobacteraceae bacterium]